MITGRPIDKKDFTWDVTLNMAGNRGTLGDFVEGVDYFYVTAVQIGGVKAASIPNGGDFLALTGNRWLRETTTVETVDENGNVVDGDRIMYVCGKYLMEQGRLEGNTIVTTVMSNLGLYKACDKIGMKYEQTAVGDKYVYENMMQNGFVLGGEQSGHIIFSKHARTGDGILTSLMLMEVMLEKKQTLGKLADEVTIFPQVLKNVRVKDKKTARENPAVVEAVQKAADALGSDGRILVRESGTEPVIRVMVEAASDEICEKYVDSVVDVIKAEGLTD